VRASGRPAPGPPCPAQAGAASPFPDPLRGAGHLTVHSNERGWQLAFARRRCLAKQAIPATKGGTAQHIESSLRRLRTDHIDLWQFHGINSFERLAEVLRPGGALEDVQQARRAGKIRHIGFSSHSLRVALEAVASGRFETVQFPLNFVSAEAAEELVSLARAHDVGFIAMKPFAGGRIRDANLAVKYLLQFDDVVPDPGIERVGEIEEIVDIVNSGQWKLTPPERQAIKEIRARVGTRFCRQCGYCMPCPNGVDIPHICELYNDGAM